MIKVRVEFLWWSNRKVWEVSGKDMNDVMRKCEKLCYKYNAQHYQIMD